MPLSDVSILQKKTMLAVFDVSIACRKLYDREKLID